MSLTSLLEEKGYGRPTISHCYGCGYAGCPHDLDMLHKDNIGHDAPRPLVDGRTSMFMETPTPAADPVQFIVDAPASGYQFHAHGSSPTNLTAGHILSYDRETRTETLDGFRTSMALDSARNLNLDTYKIGASTVKLPGLTEFRKNLPEWLK